MKKWIALILAICTALTFGACTKETPAPAGEENAPTNVEEITKLVVGLDDTFAPMGFRTEDGELVGFDIDLANAVLKNIDDKPLKFAYDFNDAVETKIESIVKKVYGGDGIVLSDLAKEKIEFINKYNFDNLPIIIAKTQFSFTDDKQIVGAPNGFKINIRDIELKTGSGFIVVIAGDMMLMPGLSKIPNAEKIDMLSDGTIIGLS